MRQVLSLSLPLETTKQIKMRTKIKGFRSVSSYIKYLTTLDDDLISEEELLQSIKEARLEHKNGQSIKANSLADLL